MAQINLLKQKTVSENLWETLPGIFLKLLLVVALGVLAYYAWLYIKINKVNAEITTIKEQNAKNLSTAFSLGQRDEVLSRQAQLKEFSSLVDKHVYWSHLLPEVAKVTLKTASYSSLRGVADGSMTLSVAVPSLNDLDKYLQVFDQPQFNKNFSDVKMGGFHKLVEEGTAMVKFDVQLKYNPNLLLYQSANNSQQ